MKVLVLTVAMGFLVSSPALAANPRASCVGLIVSDHARWGDFPELMHDIRSLASQFGMPSGTLIQSVARLHLGTHAICGNEP